MSAPQPPSSPAAPTFAPGPWRAIAARARNGMIGAGNRIPWDVPGDLAWVKEATRGGTLVMGRRTWESLGRPLPGRFHVVVSRSLPDPGLPDKVAVVRDLAALDAFPFPPSRPIWLFGGAELYRALLPRCAELYLTEIDATPEGDATFPPFEDHFRKDAIVREGPGFQVVRWLSSGA